MACHCTRRNHRLEWFMATASVNKPKTKVFGTDRESGLPTPRHFGSKKLFWPRSISSCAINHDPPRDRFLDKGWAGGHSTPNPFQANDQNANTETRKGAMKNLFSEIAAILRGLRTSIKNKLRRILQRIISISQVPNDVRTPEYEIDD